LVATAIFFAAVATLRAVGWPLPIRAVLVIPVALFWAAALAALLEAAVPSRRLGPPTLAGLGAAALAAAEALVLA
jgi:hypothetical protein